MVGRAIAAGAAFVLAAGSGLVAALVAAGPSLGLWVALGVLVITGAVLQGVVTAAERRARPRVLSSAAGAVAVGGSAREVRTRVQGGHDVPVAADGGEVTASGPGAVSIGGDAAGLISTDVTDADGAPEP